MWAWSHTGWGLIWMVFFMIVFWGAFVGLIMAIVRWSDRKAPGDQAVDAAEVLRRRFAGGEIPEKEYWERLHVLEGSRH